MNLGKKAISAVTSAALLASLVATAVAPSAFASTAITTQGVLLPWSATASAATLPADGLSAYTITFNNNTSTDLTAIRVAVTGGYFLSGTGVFTHPDGVTGTTVFPVSAFVMSSSAVINGGSATIRTATLTIASTTAGTAIFSVQYASAGAVSPATGYDSSYGFTFTGSTSTTVSTSYSSTVISASSGDQYPMTDGVTSAPATSASSGLYVVSSVRDTNNVGITSGALVTWSLSGPAYFSGVGYQSAATSTGTGGMAHSPVIFGTGAAGTVTVTTSISYLGVTYALPNVKFTFTGTVAKIALSVNNVSSSDVGTDTATAKAGTTTVGYDSPALVAALTDAAGSTVTSLGSGTVTYSLTPGGFMTADAIGAYSSSNGGFGVDITCIAAGTASLTMTWTSGTTVVTSNAVSFTCATPIDSNNLGSFTVTAAATSVAANSSTKITVTVLDKNGLPASDLSTTVSAVVNGVGNIVTTSGKVASGNSTLGGVRNYLYLAPANSGSATVTVFVSNTTTVSKSVTLTIGAGAPVPGVSSHAASALGVTKSGPFTTATKLPVKGKYVTVKFSGLTAGSSVVIMVASKSGTTWSAFAPKSTRVADASGNVYFYWKSASAAWLSFMVSGGNSVQARWR